MNENRTERFEDVKPIDYERLAYVDFKLFFTGTIKRSDMKDMFDLGDAAASKVFSRYKIFDLTIWIMLDNSIPILLIEGRLSL